MLLIGTGVVDMNSIDDLVRSRLQASYLCGCQFMIEGHCNFLLYLCAEDSKANQDRKINYKEMREGRRFKCSGHKKLLLCRLRIPGPSVAFYYSTRWHTTFDKFFEIGPSLVKRAEEMFRAEKGSYVAFRRKVEPAVFAAPKTSYL
jgi:hypothetical protein